MPKFQVVSVKPLSGTSRTTQRPYNMLAVSGVFTSDEGVMEVGEVVFMERLAAGVKLPLHVKPGQTYTPVIGVSSRDGKLQFEITELQPVAAPALQKAS